MRAESITILEREVEFQFSRSSGPGGQNVNKVNSKVTLNWDLESSSAIGVQHKNRFREKFKNQISAKGVFQFSVEETRDQHRNKDLAFKKLLKSIQSVSVAPKKRIKTKPSKRAKEKRLSEKKSTKERKVSRRKSSWEG
jgi:ribosome-associated protein